MQSVHVTMESFENLPVLQAPHMVAPEEASFSVVFPAGQNLHLVPELAEKYPGKHSSHPPLPSRLSFPAGQLTHWSPPEETYNPAVPDDISTCMCPAHLLHGVANGGSNDVETKWL